MLRSQVLAANGGMRSHVPALGIADNNLVLERDTLYITEILLGPLTLELPTLGYGEYGRRVGITVTEGSEVALFAPGTDVLRYGQVYSGSLLQGQYVLESGDSGMGTPAWIVRGGETAFGSYQPNAFGFLNVASVSASNGQWSRVGGVITVSTMLQVQPTLAGVLTVVRMETVLGQGPIQQDGSWRCAGVAVPFDTAVPVGSIAFGDDYGDPYRPYLRVVPVDTANVFYNLLFQYKTP